MTSFFNPLFWRALEAQLFYKQFILLKKELTTAGMDLEGGWGQRRGCWGKDLFKGVHKI